MAILVTGGAGFIGSHTVVELQNAGYDVVVVDNLVNSSRKSLERVEKITGKEVTFYEADINDAAALNEIFEKESIDSVIHFAGLKAVGESVAKPLEYYMNNISGSLTLFDVMRNHGVKNIAMNGFNFGHSLRIILAYTGSGYFGRALQLQIMPAYHFAIYNCRHATNCFTLGYIASAGNRLFGGLGKSNPR